MKKLITLWKIQVTMKTFAPPFFNHFNSGCTEKKNRAVMRAIRKKLNIFTLQLPIYYILEQEILISASARGGCNAYCFG